MSFSDRKLRAEEYGFRRPFQPIYALLVASQILILGCSAPSLMEMRGCSGCFESPEYFAAGDRGRTNRKEPPEPKFPESADVGLALAGGGTRASQISIGILQGLHESGLLNRITYLSTVSGGGYAGLWYMAQKANGETADEMFIDCIPRRYSAIAIEVSGKIDDCHANQKENNQFCLCPKAHTNILKFDLPQTKYADPFRHQNHLRGHTDLFARTFSYQTTRRDDRFLPSIIGPSVFQIGQSLTTDVVSDIFFDWNWNSSTSREIYRKGIEQIYAMPPVDCALYLNRIQGGGAKPGECLNTRPLWNEAYDEGSTNSQLLGFQKLRDNYSSGSTILPFWIINATTPVLDCPTGFQLKCLIEKFFTTGPYPLQRSSFEFTAFYGGSGEHQYWPDGEINSPNNQLTLTEAVSASAAFFDPNEKTVKGGGIFNLLQQLLGFKWGYYTPNPNQPELKRTFHKFLPFPLYFLHNWRETRDAVDIHLIDGGQSDNLGAYALIVRRIPNIIISDHAGEKVPGNMEDICNLKRSLASKDFSETNNGYVWHIGFDSLTELEKVCNEEYNFSESDDNLPMAPTGPQKFVYNTWAWKNPVSLGCAVEIPRDELLHASSKRCDQLRNEISTISPNELRRFLNLALIKGGIDLTRYLKQRAASRKHSTSRPEMKSEIEILGFLNRNKSICNEKGVLVFPNHSTINLTIDSSPWLFGAYRENAASAARQLQFLDQDGQIAVRNPNTMVYQHPQREYDMWTEARRLTEKLNTGEHCLAQSLPLIFE